MIRRPRRGIAATLVSLALLAVCVLVSTSAIQLLLGEPPLLSYDAAARTLHEWTWNELPVAVGGGVLAVVGVALLLLAVLPGRPVVLPLAGAEGSTLDTGANRRSLCGDLRSTAASVEGVSGAKLRLRKGRALVRVTTNRTNSEGIADSVRAAVEHRLDDLTPARRPRVRVRVSGRRSDR